MNSAPCRKFKSKTALLVLFLRAFAKADAGPAAVLVDELDAGQLKCPSEHSDRLRPHAKPVRSATMRAMRLQFTNPLLISEDNELIAGHGRYEAAKLLGLAEVPVIVIAGLSPAKRRSLPRR